MPGMLPMAKQMADSWNGGIVPEAAVNSARNDHIRMAEKPISVARNFILPPFATPRRCLPEECR